MKTETQKWGYDIGEGYYFDLAGNKSLFIELSDGTLMYTDMTKLYFEIARFDKETGEVTAEIRKSDYLGTDFKFVKHLPNISANKDLFLKASGLSRPARTLAHIIFDALD